MYRSGLVDTLVNHTNTNGFGLTPLLGDHRGFMPPQLKTKTKQDYLLDITDVKMHVHTFNIYVT